ncbi:MAG: tandem-95 repeat protein, partial [Chloroflexota bacterium]|nr:tandem-95 repeat protein [Chloroflexota bacterium]
VTYTPEADFYGSDSFTYTISDGNGGFDSGTVDVTVTSVNDDPTANDDSETVGEDSGPNGIAVLSNDSFAPDSGETLSVTGVGAASHGTVAFASSVVTYTPEADFYGSDSFTYTISDGNGGFDSGTVDVTVTSVNDTLTVSTVGNGAVARNPDQATYADGEVV